MATTAIWGVKGWLGKVVIYVENPEKTENPGFYQKPDMTDKDAQGLADVIEYAVQDDKVREKAGVQIGAPSMSRYVTGINCAPSTARDEMLAVKKRYGKEDGIVAFHGYQSFAPGEATPDTAHAIGIKMAQQLWGERFQVIVATHLDKENHIHNRFFRLARNFGEEYTLDAICRRILSDGSRPGPKVPPQKQAVTIYRFKGDLKKSKRIGGLRSLYLHYCYKLGILPKGRASPKNLHFLLREDIRKMKSISQEAGLLARNQIDTAEQLSSYKENLQTEIATLTSDRKKLKSKLRGTLDEQQLSALKTDISAINNQLSALRREVKLCDSIAGRSGIMTEKLKAIRQEQVKEKEEQSHEHRRRSGRTGL